MFMSIASTIKKTIYAIIFFILLLISLFFYALLNGIEIERVDLNVINIENLFFKFDEKLILTAKKLEINEQSESKSSLEQLDKILSNFQTLLTFFQKISIENLNLKEQNLSILYQDSFFYIDSQYLNLTTFFEFNEEKKLIKLDIKSLILKDYDLFTNGLVSLDLANNELKYLGQYIIDSISGQIYIRGDEDDIVFKLNSEKATSIKYLEKYVNLDKEIKSWIFEKVSAKSYKIDYLTFTLDRKLKFDLNSLKVNANLNDAKVKFNPKLAPIDAKNIQIKFINNRITFNLDTPKYLNMALDGSFVDITNLIESPFSNPTLNLLIKSNTGFNKNIIEILKAYNINFPFQLNSSSINNALKISMDLIDKEKPIDVSGLFQIENSNLTLDNMKFFVKTATLYLKNNTLLIRNLIFNYENILDINTNLEIDFNLKNVTGLAFVNKFELKNGELIKLEKFFTPIKFSYKDNLSFDLKKLNLQLLNSQNYTFININDLSRLYFSSGILQKLKIKDGDLKIKTKDFKNFDIFANLKNLDTPLFKNGKFIGDKIFSIKVQESGNININSTNNDLTVSIDKNENINANLNAYDIFLPDIKKLKDEKEKEPKKDENFNLKLKAKNSNIYFGNRVILSENFELNKNRDNIVFSSKYYNSILKLEKTKNGFSFKANNLNEIALQSFILDNSFIGGLYNFEAKGDEEMFKGTISFQNIIIKNLKVLNNIVSFLDTIPALITFQTPDFSLNGYEVRWGKIEFAYFKNLIYIRKFELKGESIDIEGEGMIDLENENVDVKLRLSTIKNLSKIIKNIPLVGYLILGDGKITTNLSVTGNIYNPEIQTNMLKDTLKAPVNIIQRAITLPIKFIELFEDEEDKKK